MCTDLQLAPSIQASQEVASLVLIRAQNKLKLKQIVKIAALTSETVVRTKQGGLLGYNLATGAIRADCQVGRAGRGALTASQCQKQAA